MAEKSGKFEALEDLQHDFRSGHIIVETTLFEVDKGTVTDSWELDEGSYEEMAKQARKVANLSNRQRVVIDTEGVYNADVVSDEGDLVTAQEAFDRMEPEDQDDYESFAEHCSGL